MHTPVPQQSIAVESVDNLHHVSSHICGADQITRSILCGVAGVCDGLPVRPELSECYIGGFAADNIAELGDGTNDARSIAVESDRAASTPVLGASSVWLITKIVDTMSTIYLGVQLIKSYSPPVSTD